MMVCSINKFAHQGCVTLKLKKKKKNETWNGSEEDGNVRSECEEDGDSDIDW